MKTTKRRTKKNVQPPYPQKPLPTEPPSEQYEIAAELPVTYNALAGGIAKWEDPLLELSATAYLELRRCLAVKKAVRKLSIRTAKLNWTVVSGKTAGSDDEVQNALPVIDAEGVAPAPEAQPKPPASKRAQAVKEIFGQIQSWSDLLEHFTGSLLEGTRFAQIKASPAREGSMAAWVVPNFWMGTRHRYNAGGDIEWDGGDRADSLRQVERTTSQHTRKAKNLPIKQFAIHRPGPGSNPEGDLDLGVAVYNATAKPWNRGITSGDLWVRLFAIPAILAGAKIDKSKPDSIATRFQQQANKIQQAMIEQKPVGLSDDHMVQLLQADPSGLSGMVAWQQYLESLCDDALTMAALTSSAGVAQASRTGNTKEQKDNEDEAAFANGVLIAETFNRHILPWIFEKNPDLPPLEEGEMEVYLWPKDPNDNDEQDVDVEPEGEQEAPTEVAENVKRLQIKDTLEAVTFGSMTPEAAKLYLNQIAPGGDYGAMVDASVKVSA